MNSEQTHVIYNAECPVCSFEIDHYAAYSKDRELALSFHDLNQSDLAQWGLTEDQAARRLYVVRDGQMLDGIPAFLVLWQQMPRYHWLARVIGLPGVRQIAVLTYDYILAPVIYRWHKRRRAKAGRPVQG